MSIVSTKTCLRRILFPILTKISTPRGRQNQTDFISQNHSKLKIENHNIKKSYIM